jgi:hypothetical protein
MTVAPVEFPDSGYWETGTCSAGMRGITLPPGGQGAPCYAMLCHAMPCYAMLSSHAVPCQTSIIANLLRRYSVLRTAQENCVRPQLQHSHHAHAHPPARNHSPRLHLHLHLHSSSITLLLHLTPPPQAARVETSVAEQAPRKPGVPVSLCPQLNLRPWPYL